MRRPTVTVYSRRGCHLCADAERLVAEVAGERADVRVVDVDGDPELAERYTVRVPVVAVDDVEVAELVVSREELEAALGVPGGS